MCTRKSFKVRVTKADEEFEVLIELFATPELDADLSATEKDEHAGEIKMIIRDVKER